MKTNNTLSIFITPIKGEEICIEKACTLKQAVTLARKEARKAIHNGGIFVTINIIARVSYGVETLAHIEAEKQGRRVAFSDDQPGENNAIAETSNEEEATTLKGMAKHTYNRVMSAMAEDTTPAMLHAFAALTDGAKAIVLQSGKYSNLYIRGDRKGIAVEEAAKELTERAAAGVTSKLRKIDHICAVAFLAEYISRQRKAEETPETPNPDNIPTTMNANEKRTKSINGIMNQANRLMSVCNAVQNFKRADVIRAIAFRYYDNIRASVGRFNYNDDSEYNKEYSRAQYMNANKPKTTEFSELSHAGQRLGTYLHNDSFIYEYYTQKAIEAIINDGLSISSEDVRRYVRNAIDHASWQVEKYDHMTPTAQDIEQVTRNYVAYIVECAQ